MGISSRAESFQTAFDYWQSLKTAVSHHFFVGFHGNDFIIRINNDFAVLPEISSYPWLTLYLLKQSFYKYMTMKFPPSALFLTNTDNDLRLMMNQPICQPVRVNFDRSLLRRLLAIHSACNDNGEPVWRFTTTPSGTEDVQALTDILKENNTDESSFARLWHEMTLNDLHTMTLRPFEDKGDNRLSLSACVKDKPCYRINFAMDMGKSASQQWLLSQLAFGRQPQKHTISAFQHQIIESISSVLFCLRKKQTETGNSQSEPCFNEYHLSQEENNTWTVQPPFRHPSYPYKDWLYNGRGIRILPLHDCQSEEQPGIYRCPGFLFWGEDYSQRGLTTGMPYPVLFIGFDHKPENYRDKFFNHDYSGIGALYKTTNSAEQFLELVLTGSHYLSDYRLPGRRPLPSSQENSKTSGLTPGGVNRPAKTASVQPYQLRPYQQASSPLITKMTREVMNTQDRQASSNGQEAGRHTEKRRVAGRYLGIQHSGGTPSGAGAGGAGGGPPGPPAPGGAFQSGIEPFADIEDLLQSLTSFGLAPSNYPASPWLTNVLAQSGDYQTINSQHDHLLALAQSHPELAHHPLIRSVPVSLLRQCFSRNGFDPDNHSHLALLSELLRLNVTVLLAGQKGSHRYRHHSPGTSVNLMGLFNFSPGHISLTGLVLVKMPGGFIQMNRVAQQSFQTRLSPPFRPLVQPQERSPVYFIQRLPQQLLPAWQFRPVRPYGPFHSTVVPPSHAFAGAARPATDRPTTDRPIRTPQRPKAYQSSEPPQFQIVLPLKPPQFKSELNRRKDSGDTEDSQSPLKNRKPEHESPPTTGSPLAATEQRSILPVGMDEVSIAFKAWPRTNTEQQAAEESLPSLTVKETIRHLVLQEPQTQPLLEQTLDYLARAGLVAVLPRGPSGERRLGFSKTLLGWLEQFWLKNHDELIESNQAATRKILQDIDSSGSMRQDLKLGSINNPSFSPAFIDAGLPAMKALTDLQGSLIREIAGQVSRFAAEGHSIAVYGGMAKRAHTVSKVASGDLNQAIKNGVLSPVNDMDVMAGNEQLSKRFLQTLLTQLRQQFPELIIPDPVDIPSHTEHLKTKKVTLFWQRLRVFTVDVTISSSFDFTDVTSLPLHLGTEDSTSAPVIGFQPWVTQLIQESLKTNSNDPKEPDAERRRTEAMRTLWQLREIDDHIIPLLEQYHTPDWTEVFSYTLGLSAEPAKLAGRGSKSVRASLTEPLLNPGSPRFDPAGLLNIYRASEALGPPESNSDNKYQAINQYLWAISRAGTECEREDALQILHNNSLLSEKLPAITDLPIIAVIIAGQFDWLEKKVIKGLIKEVSRRKSELASFLDSFLFTERYYILDAVNTIPDLTVPLAIEKILSGKQLSAIYIAGLARKLAVSEQDRDHFARAIASLPAESGQQKIIQEWLYRIIRTGDFLLNVELVNDLGAKIHAHNPVLGQFVFDIIQNWQKSNAKAPETQQHNAPDTPADISPNQQETPQAIAPEPDQANLISDIQTLELNDPAVVMAVTKTAGKKQATVPTPNSASAHNSQSVDNLVQLLTVFVSQPQHPPPPHIWPIAEQLAKLEHPAGQFTLAALYWLRDGKISPAIRYNCLYPAAQKFYPALKLLERVLRDSHSNLSVLDIERLRQSWLAQQKNRRQLINLNSLSKALTRWMPESLTAESLAELIILMEALPPLTDKQPAPLRVLEKTKGRAYLKDDIRIAMIMRAFWIFLDDRPNHEDPFSSQSYRDLNNIFRVLSPYKGRQFFEHLLKPYRQAGRSVRMGGARADNQALQMAADLSSTEDDSRLPVIAKQLISVMADRFRHSRDMTDEILGAELAWLPFIQHRHRTVVPLVSVLKKQERFTAVAAFYEALFKGADDEVTVEVIHIMEQAIQFLIQHHDQFEEQLEKTVTLYMRKLSLSAQHRDHLSTHADSLTTRIYEHITGDAANRLHEIINRARMENR